MKDIATKVFLILSIIVLFSIPISNGLCNSNCSACALEYSPPFTVVYNASKARPDLRGQTFSMYSSDSSVISSSVSKYFIIQGGILRINNATNFSRNEIALNVFGNTILPVTYRFSILAFTNPPTGWIISVCVQGLDNNTPTFPKSEIQFSVIEGTVLSQPMDLAADNDEGENSTQNYSILSNDPSVNSDLYLDIARNSDKKITSILLTSIAPLRKGSYNFTMVAQEGRPNTTKGYQKVYVIVQYLCNSLPIFELPTYQISLPLRTPVNAIIINFKAVHVNSQTTAPIYYSITSGCSTGQASIRCTSSSGSANLGPFALDYRSGNLTLTSALDYYQAHQFNITLVATDACNLVGSALVFVQITLIPPSIQVIFSNNGMIREDYALTSYVATVIVNDPDGVNVSVIVLDNTTGIMSDTFYLVNLGSSYRLRLLHTLDSKIKSSYYITIQASDPANNIVYFTFNVTIVGVNHPPVFENKIVFINIPYNIANGIKVMRVHASDNDLGGNGVVTYELPPPNATFPYQNFFTVNNTSGDVLVIGVIDKAVAGSFSLLIMARDNPTDGESFLSDYMIVNVSVINVNLTKASLQLQPSKICISRGTAMISQTVAFNSISNIETLPALSTQAILPVYSTLTDQVNPSIQLSVTIITIIATLAAVIVVMVCMIVFIIACCFHHRKQKGKVTITINPCDQLELHHACYEQSKADMHCNDIVFVSSAQEKDGLQHSPMKQGESAPHADKVRTIQSTSDLASTISTDMIADSESTGPYSKVQLMAIYAANAQLLNNTGSQNSMHMFGSEGGIEVDDVDMNNLSFDEDEDADSIQMNDAINSSSLTNSNANAPIDKAYKHRTVVQPATNKQLYLASSVDTIDGVYNTMGHQRASQKLLLQQHDQQWEQPGQEYCSDTRLNIQQKQMKSCGSSRIANRHHDHQQTRKYSTPACKMIPSIIQPHTSISFSSPDHAYSSGFFCATRFPSSTVGSHVYARSATPHSATETDNSTLSSMQTNRAPEHYHSNFSLGSTSLSQPVP